MMTRIQAPTRFDTPALIAGLPAGVELPPQPDVDLQALRDARCARLRDALCDAPYDALLLTEPESVHYATGYRSMPIQVFRSHQVAAVVTPDDLWLVCAASDAPAAAAAGVPVDRLVTFGRFYVEQADDDADHLALSEGSDRHPDLRTAVESAVDRLPAGTVYGVESPAASTVWTDSLGKERVGVAAGVIAKARGIKMPDEIELLRYSAHLAEVAVQAALAVAGPGTTERQLAAVISSTMVAGGGDPRFVVATTGPRSALADVIPSDRPWQVGEMARFDVGCLVEGYWSDIGRTAVLGQPDARHREVFEAVDAGVNAQLQLAAPGVQAADLFTAGLDGTGERVPTYRRQHCGHGIGLSIYEPPVLTPDDETVLQQDMTFCFETPYYELGWGGMMVEDAVVITADGVELLSGTGRGLTVVPA